MKVTVRNGDVVTDQYMILDVYPCPTFKPNAAVEKDVVPYSQLSRSAKQGRALGAVDPERVAGLGIGCFDDRPSYDVGPPPHPHRR
jgi:hypothetical protein